MILKVQKILLIIFRILDLLVFNSHFLEAIIILDAGMRFLLHHLTSFMFEFFYFFFILVHLIFCPNKMSISNVVFC